MSFRSQSFRNHLNEDETLFSVFYINKGYEMGIKAHKDANIDELQRTISDLNDIPIKEQVSFE